MKTTRLSILTILFIFSLLCSGCGAAPATQAPTAEALAPTATAAPTQKPTATEAPIPTATPAPTATPEPIDCTIVFDSDRDGNYEIYAMDADGGSPHNLTNSEGDDWLPAISPDGRRVAFVSNRPTEDGGGQFIYVMNIDGSKVYRLSDIPLSDHPDWAPDGSAIVFAGDADGKGQRDIFVALADGSAPAVNLTANPEKDTEPSWSPDGRMIAWLSGDDRSHDIFVMNLAENSVQQITHEGNLNGVTWTIDGQLFTVWDSQEHGCCNLVLSADGANVQEAGGKGDLQKYLPFWTLSGDRVELAQVSLDGGDEEIYQVGEIFDGYFNNLTNNPATDRNPDWPALCGPENHPAVEPVVLPESPVAGNTTGESKAIIMGYAGDDPAQPQRKAAFQDACDELGITCLYGEIPELLEQGAMSIVQNTGTVPLDDLRADLQAAHDQDIPVFVLDAEIDEEGVYSVSINHEQWVEMTLQWMYDVMDGSNMAILDLQPLYAQGAAIEKKLSGNPGIQIVAQESGAYDPELIHAQVAQLLADHPDLDGIWSSAGQTEILRALMESGLPTDQWPLTLCEPSKIGLKVWRDVQSNDPSFLCLALMNPPSIAYEAVYIANFLLEGRSFHPESLGGAYGHNLSVDIEVVGPDDLADALENLAGVEAETRLDVRLTPKEILQRWFEQ